MTTVIVKIFSYLISCASGSFIIFDFCNKLYSKKKSENYYRVTVAIFACAWFSICFLGIPLLNLSFMFVASLLVALFLYSGNALRKTIHIAILCFSYVCLDVIIATVISGLTKSTIPLYSSTPVFLLINVIFVQLIMFIGYRGLIIFLRKENSQENQPVPKKQFAVFIFLPALNVLVLYILSVLAADRIDNLIMLLMALLLAILNVLTIYFFDYIIKAENLQQKMELMQIKMDSQYAYYKQLETMNDQSQKMIHDIKNHLQVIQALKNEEANEYANRILDIVDNSTLKFRSCNKLLNIILNLKIEECEKSRIKFQYEIENIDFSFLNDIDITAIFANLLDNAIEGCNRMRSNNKSIDLRIYKYNDMIVVTLINTFDQNTISVNDGAYLSSKGGHKALGLSNIKQAVCKYNGDMNIQVEDSCFVTSIIFPV